MFQKGMLPQSSVSHSLPFLQCYTTFLQNVANYLPVNYRDIEDSNIQHNAMYIMLRLLYHTYLTAFLSLVSSNLWWPTLPDRLSFLLTPALPGDLSWLAPPGDPLISNSSHSIPSDRSPNSYKNKVFAWLFNNSVGRTTKNKVHTKKISCHRIRVNVTIKSCRLKYYWENDSAGLTSTVCPTILDFISETDVPLYTLYKKHSQTLNLNL